MTRRSPLVLLAVLSTCLLAERPAAACGGTFCDSTPLAMPVNQTGENILFALDGTTVEAHVQIQYQGDPARFAWIVPMPAVPTVSVGSEQLFSNLLTATVPRYGAFTQQDSCPCPSCGFGVGGATGAGGFPSVADASAGDSGVSVLFRKTVGTFDVTALTGHSSTEVVSWLTANGYQNISTAPAILDRYVQKGSVFVAVKLTAGSGTDQIHPLVFRYVGTEPCIPLELTAVAAVPDMGVRAFFLGNSRVVSTNYASVTLDDARIDWSLGASNYNPVVSAAVDEAGGHAFVTEFSGSSGVVAQQGLSGTFWDETRFPGLAAGAVVPELQAQGLLYCNPSYCQPYHPLVFPLLHEFIPPPNGVSDAAFYSCVDCYSTDATSPGDGGAAAFDSVAFATALRDRIFDPGRHAAALLARWPHLTRLFTTISPAEMTLDPFFASRTDLPDVPLPGMATRRIAMDGRSGMTLPSGLEIAMDGTNWPAFTNAMPWASRIESYPPGQPSSVVVDNAASIALQVSAWNTSQSWPAPPPVCPPPGAGSGGTTGTGGNLADGSTRTGAGGTSGTRSSTLGGCSIGRGSGPGAARWLGVAAVIAAWTASRRRRRQAALPSRSWVPPTDPPHSVFHDVNDESAVSGSRDPRGCRLRGDGG